MGRFVIMTVGKTHSGKTTFAKALEQQLTNAVVIDQDNHAEFINTYYKALQPKTGPNALKYAISQTIVNHAINETDLHIILCNSNRNRQGRLDLLNQFHSQGFTSILVHFDISYEVLQERVTNSQRSTAVLRSAYNFQEVLKRQQTESESDPVAGEAGALLTIKNNEDVQSAISKIVSMTENE